MLYLTHTTKILLSIEPIDFRKQLDGLIALCEQHLSQDPRDGQFFVFINRSKTMIRVLNYENNGYWLATKRLSKGRYSAWPKDAAKICHPILASDLTKILKTFVATKRY